jgi:hypothetical protein
MQKSEANINVYISKGWRFVIYIHKNVITDLICQVMLFPLAAVQVRAGQDVGQGPEP